MRLLVDEHSMDWDQAWEITQRTCGYTNHTLLPEALEKWPLPLFASFCRATWKSSTRSTAASSTRCGCAIPATISCFGRLSLIDEAGEQYVRMAHLACVGSHAVNGVAALHTELLKETVLRDFYAVAPEKFINVTNGVTPRRWMALSNPKLSALITGKIGDRWISRSGRRLERIEPFADDPGFQQRVARDQSRQQARPGRLHQGAHRHQVDPAVALRHPGETAARVQAAAPERAVRRSRSTTGSSGRPAPP